MSASVLIAAVSYFGGSELPGLIESVVAGSHQDWRLVVVDNADDAAEWAVVSAAASVDSRSSAVRAPANLGYLGGVRCALQNVDLADFDWVVVTNVDVRFGPDFLHRLSDREPECVVAPSILSSITGSDQNPYLRERPGRWLVRRWRWEFAFVPVGRLVVAAGNSRLHRRKRSVGSEPTAIYAPHGSCVALPREFFVRGGSLAHEPFLFAEEITIAEQCRALGISVVHDPALRVRHREHASTGVWRSAPMIRWQREAVDYTARLLGQKGKVRRE